MKLTRLLPLVPFALVAQAPPAQPSMGERFRTESPVIEKMLADLQYPEALQRAEALVATPAEPFDKTRTPTGYASYQRFWATGRAYFLAANAARMNGLWEKARDYYQKALDVAKENVVGTREVLTRGIADLKADTLAKRGQIDGNADYIKWIKSLPKPSSEELQQLELIKKMEEGITNNDKWIGLFNKAMEHTEAEAKSLATHPEAMAKEIAAQEEQLENYKFKNDKVKFVEGITSSKPYMDSIRAMAKPDALYNLYRLSVLDPENKRILREIDILLGKPVGPEPLPVKPKKKGSRLP
jgi:tetratricopeptide (TPR) repeat protein